MSALAPLQYTALEPIRAPRPVSRLDYLAELARERFVFDLGALDETAYAAKQDNGKWLHARLCASAARVLGLDNSPLVPEEGLDTQPNGRIVRADIFQLGALVAEHGRPDLIVAGELIEHLPDTLGFLRSLAAEPALRGALFAFSTPNACSWHNALIGVAGRESTHCDHLQIYSYKTLRTLFDRAGIELRQLLPYHARFDEMIENTRGPVRLGVRGFQGAVNALEYLAPAMAGGWIGVARL